MWRTSRTIKRCPGWRACPVHQVLPRVSRPAVSPCNIATLSLLFRAHDPRARRPALPTANARARAPLTTACHHAQGVYCNETGTEFYTVHFVEGTWQDFEYTRQDPRRLDKHGTEPCRAMQGATCPGGPWNTTCDFGYQGPMCGVCDMGPDVMAPTHYRDKSGACVKCGDTKVAWGGFVGLCVGVALLALLLKRYGCRPCCVVATRCCPTRCTKLCARCDPRKKAAEKNDAVKQGPQSFRAPRVRRNASKSCKQLRRRRTSAPRRRTSAHPICRPAAFELVGPQPQRGEGLQRGQRPRGCGRERGGGGEPAREDEDCRGLLSNHLLHHEHAGHPLVSLSVAAAPGRSG